MAQDRRQPVAQDHGQKLAVPLDVAAQLLARPLPELERAGVEPYRHAQGFPVYSLRELAISLGIVKAAKSRGGVKVQPKIPIQRIPRPVQRQRHGGIKGSWPLLNHSQAQAAAERARLVGVKAAAKELGVGRQTLYETWARNGITVRRA